MTWSIITGGQTGVDTGALMAARDLGIPWKAVLPRGYKREKPMPDWMREHASEYMGSDRYDDRTRAVVLMSNIVVLLGAGMGTPGTTLTAELAAHYNKPLFIYRPGFDWPGLAQEHGPVIMVAGPRGSKWPDGSGVAYRAVKEMTWLPF